MLNKFASLFLVLALTCAVCRTSTFAQAPPQTETELGVEKLPSSPSKPTAERERDEKLKANVATLLSDARAGKITPAPKSQITHPSANHLSKKAKVAIVVGIVLVVTAIIVWKSFEWDCKSRCVL